MGGKWREFSVGGGVLHDRRFLRCGHVLRIVCRPKSEGLADVRGGDDVHVVEISDGAGDPEHAVIRSGRQGEFIGGANQQRARSRLEARGRGDEPHGGGRVGETGERRMAARIEHRSVRGVRVARPLPLAGAQYARPHHGGSFSRCAGSVLRERSRRYPLHVHMQIDAIGERPGKPLPMSLEIGHGTAAGFVVASGVSTRTRIAGGDEGEP